MGYYFTEVNTKTIENNNDTLDLIFEIELGDKAKISQIEFIGDKKIKDRTLRNVIISEESKFWKFISKRKFIDKSRISLDTRLLKNFYLNQGFYNAEINSSFAKLIDNNEFELIFNIKPGDRIFFSFKTFKNFI